MAAKGNLGMRLDLDQIPVRDSSITAEEILLSESQERMLLICEPARYPELHAVFTKWGLDAKTIGEVISERQMQLHWKGDLLTSIDPHLLVENAPSYERPYSPWRAKKQLKVQTKWSKAFSVAELVQEFNSVDHASRKNIYQQYDQRVGLNTVRGADHDVAVLRLPDSGRALAVNVGCRHSLMKMDARIGALDSVFYPVLQMSLKGFRPLAITDCLNFGNPEKPEIMSEFVASVEAITEASLLFEAPVVSGNVSFYNETLGKNIISTPAIGVVGLKENLLQIPTDHFKKIGSSVYRLSCASVFLEQFLKQENETPCFTSELNLKRWLQFASDLRELSQEAGVHSTQMVSLGGLALSLLKMSSKGLGFFAATKLSDQDLKQDVLYQALFEVDAQAAANFENRASSLDVRFEKIGTVASDRVEFRPGVFVLIDDVCGPQNQGLRRHIENLA
jgi:phosphoribosylformylglycinamidine synthase